MSRDAYSVLRPLLFRLSADHAHDLARMALRWPFVWRLFEGPKPDPTLATSLARIPLASPIGLAPGFDKNGELLEALGHLGFGYLMAGSITREPRFGNPFPRLVRYPERESIANSMGLPNKGLATAVGNLRGRRSRVPVIASVAGFSADELVESAEAAAPYVAGVEIGLVCPNTTETERLEEIRIFSALVQRLAETKTKPVFMKLPNGNQKAMIDACIEAGLDGISVSGTRPVVEPRLGMGRGSLAGREVFEDALRIAGEAADRAQGRLAIKAAGGVFTGEDAQKMIHAGATTVEVYSAFIYRGWNVARYLNEELSALQTASGVTGMVRSTAP
ncbi:MAG: dihydroorotate dehydrogenase 2 [Chloroflexi bacterium]|nr:dihydroorotate dehydrogenase 2 [Chloroflexota bacterium]